MPKGTICLRCAHKSTMITVKDGSGEAVAWTSRPDGKSPAEHAAKEALAHGIDSADLIVKGHGPGRADAIAAIMASGIAIGMIKDETPIPHNGARPKKKRGT